MKKGSVFFSTFAARRECQLFLASTLTDDDECVKLGRTFCVDRVSNSLEIAPSFLVLVVALQIRARYAPTKI